MGTLTESQKADAVARDVALGELERLAGWLDIEVAHIEADDVLCVLLNHLGYGDVVLAWSKVGKWYA